ncbi:MAG: hypothetical protein PHZ16_04555, partial [Eubacteriales bacterium]|nr:hypothetical protein [Eubacteriales bacterium]
LALFAESKMFSFVAEIPYSSSELEAYVRDYGVVDKIEYGNDHIRMEGKIQKSKLGPLTDYVLD